MIDYNVTKNTKKTRDVSRQNLTRLNRCDDLSNEVSTVEEIEWKDVLERHTVGRSLQLSSTKFFGKVLLSLSSSCMCLRTSRSGPVSRGTMRAGIRHVCK